MFKSLEVRIKKNKKKTLFSCKALKIRKKECMITFFFMYPSQRKKNNITFIFENHYIPFFFSLNNSKKLLIIEFVTMACGLELQDDLQVPISILNIFMPQ